MLKNTLKTLILISVIIILGCEDENVNENSNNKVIADFITSDTIINLNESILFSDNSKGNPTSWYWEFEGGTPFTSTAQNPIIVYNKEGFYDVKLVVQNNIFIDTLVKKKHIIVENLEPINFELTWQKSMGEFNKSELVFSFIKTSDGGYMSAGSIWLSNENTDVCIVKYNNQFDVIWEKIFAGNYSERGSSLIETSDGKFIVAGSTNSTEGQIKSFNGYYDIFLLKFDNNGEVLWQKSYGGSEYDGCENNSLIELSNGNLIISGTSGSVDGDISKSIGGKDFWLVNLKNDGIIEWEKSFGGSQDEFGRQVIIFNDELIIGLKSNSNDGDFTSEGNIVAKLSLDGEIDWVTNLGGMNYGKTIIDKNGGYLSIIGNSENGSDFEVIKIDDAGSILWKNSFGGSMQEFGNDIIQLYDNSLIILGLSSSNDGEILNNYGSADDVIVAKLSVSGKLLGLKNFGGSNREWARCILDIGNSEYVINASTSSDDHDVINNFGAIGIDNWIIKIKEIIPN